MSCTVSRNKYEKAKKAARAWHSTSEKLQEKLAEAEYRYKKLLSHYKKVQEQHDQLQTEIDGYPDLEDTLDSLQAENKRYGKQLQEQEEKYREKLALFEREKILYENKIQQLEQARKDLQERYTDLKQDFREQQRWLSGKPQVA